MTVTGRKIRGKKKMEMSGSEPPNIKPIIITVTGERTQEQIDKHQKHPEFLALLYQLKIDVTDG